MSTVIKSLYESFLDLLYEHKCPFEIEHICSMHGHCSADGWSKKVCSFCFNELVDLSLEPRRDLIDLELVVSAAEYKNEAKTITQKFKWSNPKLVHPIAELINYKLTNCPEFPDIDYLIPVPGLMNEDRNWLPSVLLSQELSKLLEKPYIEPLQKSQETKLYRLDKVNRRKTVQNSYQIKPSHKHGLKNYAFEGKKLLIVDDLIASGSTIEICAQLLKRIHPENKIYAVTFTSVSSGM
ncbi:MAG: phosphoribosyltransferase family protein [Candidatus Caenarcaniphilales bacterium]|nr:phosphoribosyltransferase family protein [Candidatus Caenarcaniphilales bacterium]